MTMPDHEAPDMTGLQDRRASDGFVLVSMLAVALLIVAISSLKLFGEIGEPFKSIVPISGALLVTYGAKHEQPTWIDVDNIVMCAGQLPLRELQAPLDSAGIHTHVIGGADVAAELDAKRAIDQGSRLAARL